MIVQDLADLSTFLDDRDYRFDFIDCGRNAGAFRVLLAPLVIQPGEFGAMLRGLVDQELPLCGDEICTGIRWRMKSGERVGGINGRTGRCAGF